MKAILQAAFIILTCAALLNVKASATPNSAEVSSNNIEISSNEEFQLLQSQYFPMLDLRASPDQITALPQFAARLSQVADQIRLDLAQGSISSPEQKAEAGLVFIYDALMTHNNSYAVLDGVLTLESLKAARRFSDALSSDRDELLAREQYAELSLSSAQTLRPDDRRIDSWLVAIRAMIGRIQTGSVSDATLAAVLDTIDARPTFNLWTALLMFQGRDASTELFARLVKAAKNFVDGEDLCSLRPQDCQNGIHAPYNSQSSVTVLGDAFLRKANQLMAAGNIADAMPLVHYAKGTYDVLNNPQHLPSTNTWPDRDVLAVRQESVAKLLNAQSIDDSALVASDDFKRPYECASCHGRATYQP